MEQEVGPNVNKKGGFAACLVRLAGHDFMDFRNDGGTQKGGSDGCIDFSDHNNAGLIECINESNIVATY